jgi:hypothetical protein
MPTEKHLEDVLAKYPELIEDSLQLTGGRTGPAPIKGV